MGRPLSPIGSINPMHRQSPNTIIELRLRNLGQLFNTLDPFPFRERDIAPEAEEFIVEKAGDLPKGQPIGILVHVQSPDAADSQSDTADAISRWFAGRAKAETQAIRALFRDGRVAFAIGLFLLAVCMTVAWYMTQHYSGPFSRLVQESFVIVGWVVIWRPAEMFLYDWVPMLRRRNIYQRLAASKVNVVVDSAV